MLAVYAHDRDGSIAEFDDAFPELEITRFECELRHLDKEKLATELGHVDCTRVRHTEGILRSQKLVDEEVTTS